MDSNVNSKCPNCNEERHQCVCEPVPFESAAKLSEKPRGIFAQYAMCLNLSDIRADYEYCRGFNHGLVLAEAKVDEMLVNSATEPGKAVITSERVASIEKENRELIEGKLYLARELNDCAKVIASLEKRLKELDTPDTTAKTV